MSHKTPEPQQPTNESRPFGSGAETSSAKQDEEARLFYERLEQTGQLVDVDANTDLSKLPPNVTHIRYPDGTIKRIGFSSSP